MSIGGAVLVDLRATCLLLAGSMCLLPFLLPGHMPPLRAFYSEWLAIALGTAAAALISMTPAKRPLHAPVSAVFLAGFSLVLFVRAVAVESAYAESALLWGIYVLFAALIVVVGRELAIEFGRDRVCEAVAGFLLAGALANAVAGAFQVTGIPRQLDGFISYLHGTRATGNIGQANLFANYLALGEASLIYLFARRRIEVFPAVACGFVLVSAAALAASRASTIYALIFVLLAYVSARGSDHKANRPMRTAALFLAAGIVLAQWLVPICLSAASFRIESGIIRHAVAELQGPLPDDASNLRLMAWSLAWNLFLQAPLLGVGPDEFAGAAFALGLPRGMAVAGVWTSPHNLVLQLLAETGIAGTALVVAGIGLWLIGAARVFVRNRDPAMWWLLACAGVELLHALVEYPLSYAHFLAVTALLMGVGASESIAIGLPKGRALFGLASFAGAVLLAATLRSYFKFDLASPVAAGRSLAGDAEIARDRESLAGLRGSLLTQRAETWLFMAFPLDQSDLAEKVAVGNRVLRVWPSREVVTRQCIFLALAGRREEAGAMLEHGLKSFPGKEERIAELIDSAPAEAIAVLGPLLRAHQRGRQ